MLSRQQEQYKRGMNVAGIDKYTGTGYGARMNCRKKTVEAKRMEMPQKYNQKKEN